jgi:hypothetical protein
MFALYNSVLYCLCLASSKLLGVYPIQSKMVIVDLQLCGWQSLSSLLVHRIVRIVYLCLVLLITHGWPYLQALPATVSLPLLLLPLALPRQVPSSQVILQPPEFPTAPTQGPELGYYIDKHLAALLVDYQWFRCILDSGSRPVIPRPSKDLGR